jgi:peptide/nickel transport system substrate-binding protein
MRVNVTRRDVAAALLWLAVLAPPLFSPLPAAAQTRRETLRQVTGNTINTLDATMPGATREAFGLSVNIYDRLIGFDRKPRGNGWIFDPNHIHGELAESYEMSADGRTITFHLRKDAVFQDGTPFTAEDAKWSLDRAVTAKSLAAPQVASGSWTRADQFRIVDEHTIQAVVDKPDRLALPNLAVLYVSMFNSKLAKEHATAEDPWAQAWLKDHTAGSGAYKVESFKPGEQVILTRNDAWKAGPLPFFKRVISQTIAEPATRANLVERGDADLSIDLQASDVIDLQKKGKLKLVSTPQFNAFTFVAFNTKMKPFDDVRVRQAIAAALPYADMFKAAIFGRGTPLYDGAWTGTPSDTVFPQPMPFHTDLARAKQLLTEAGYPEGFETTFSFNVGTAQVSEPMAALIKESLAKIGIRVEIQKMPDAQISTLVSEKKLPFLTESSIAWLPATDYFFRIFFQGDQRWNYSSWSNPEVTALTDKARFSTDKAEYDGIAKQLIGLEAKEAPMILLWQPNQDAVMAPDMDGYTYWYHRQVDFRDLARK